MGVEEQSYRGSPAYTDYAKFALVAERYTSPSKEAGLVIYLAFLAKVANLYNMIMTAFKKYWPDTVTKFTSGTQDRFI